ncbi:MAG: hypothetical protein HRU11_12150 [Parvularculaceae bacterium]|nr:hypothetical protein [Parvularculaceae bacterium]
MTKPIPLFPRELQVLLEHASTDHQRNRLKSLLQTLSFRRTDEEFGLKHGATWKMVNDLRRVAKGEGVDLEALRVTTSFVEHPELPSSDTPIDELLASKRARFSRTKAAKDAARWRKVRLRGGGPMGLLCFGDPHIDDDGCDIEALERDMKLVKETDGLFAGNIGDSINNWVGRLMRLHANQSTTATDAWRLAEWFLKDLDEHWVFWLLGNHDAWNDGMEVFSRMGGLVKMDDWQARLALTFDNGRECRLHAAHNFPGTSIRDKNWGEKRADAESYGAAQIYMAGHLHTAAMQCVPCPNRGKPIWYARASGYKAIDSYADNLGYSRQTGGESLTFIFDQDADDEMGFVTGFLNSAEAVDFLQFKRERHEGRSRQHGVAA